VAVGAFIIYTINNVFLKTLNQFFDALARAVGDIPGLGTLADLLEGVDFIQLQFLLYGVALVGMMLLRPEGLFPNSRRQRELHAQAEEEEIVETVEEAGSAPEPTEAPPGDSDTTEEAGR
jgi:hypothetical protein